MARKFIDTNVLITDCSDISDTILSSKTIEELENIKVSANKDAEIKYKARQAVRAIKEQKPEIIVVDKIDYDRIESLGLEVTNDNLIIAYADRYSRLNPEEDVVFCTNDILCGLIAEKYFGLKVEEVSQKKNNIYKGYKVVHGNSNTINEYMNSIDFSDWSVNEYLIIENTDDNTSKEMRFDGEKFVNLKLPSSKFIKGKNSLQRCALDILMNPDITIAAILGGYG